ncbi:ferritin-like domain-containing protein [Polaromonas sp. P5_D5]
MAKEQHDQNPDPRAAWARGENRYPGALKTAVATGDDAVDDDDAIIESLNDLLESCRDGEYGFRECAGHTKAQDIKTLLLRHADECRAAGLELQTLIRQLGGKPDEGGSVSGALHRGWVSVRATLSALSDQAMLNECERGEDAAVARYRKALKRNFPAGIRAVVERQAQGAQRNHDQVKALRDALKA